MIQLRYLDNSQPVYQTIWSSGADLKSRIYCEILPGAVFKVPTGVWVDGIDEVSLHESLKKGIVPEIQIRARSGLAAKFSISLANGVGTVDLDYRDEICVLLINHSQNVFKVEIGDRVAQMVLCLSQRISQLPVIQNLRTGGFGSTDMTSNVNMLISKGNPNILDG